MTYVGAAREGDIFFHELNLGINIYDISETLVQIEHVLNTILLYTGNANVAPIHHKGQGPRIRDSLYETLTARRAKGEMEIRYQIEALRDLHQIYDATRNHLVSSKGVLRDTFLELSRLFKGYQEVAKLNDHAYANRLTDIIFAEVDGAKEKYKDYPEVLAILNRINHDHWKAVKHLDRRSP